MVERKTPFRCKREYVTFGDGFPALGNPTSTRLRAGMRTSSRKRLFRNLRMRLLPIRVMRISRRAVATAELASSSMRWGSSTLNLCAAGARGLCQERMRNPCAETAWSLCWSRAPNLRAERTPSRSRPQVAPSRPPLRTTPNQRNLSRPSSTSRCFASSIEAVMGGSCSSSIVRPAILPPSTHRSSFKLSILRFGRRRRIPPPYV